MSTLNTTNIKHAGNTGDANLVLASDGTSTFNNDVTIDGDLSAAKGTFDGQVRIKEDVVLNSDLSLPNANTPAITVNHDRGGGTSAASFRVSADGTIRLGDKGVDSVDTNPNATIRANGSAQFSNQDSGSDAALSVTAGGTPRFYVERSGRVLIGTTLPASPNITLAASGSATFAGTVTQRYMYVNASDLAGGNNISRWDSADGTERIKFDANGDAFFRGTVHSNYSRINLEPEDPANYTTTMVDGEEQQVYSGPTLDVKEKLLEFVARIEALEATNASLEARLTALEGGSN